MELFKNGSRWLKADFHLHTKSDKEFSYTGEENSFVNDYIEALKHADISLGIITNHNKFNLNEFKALRKKAKKNEIGLLPGIELSVKDGGSGIHTLVIFSDDWFCNPENKDYINEFLSLTFARIPNFENETSHSNDDINETIRKLDEYHKDYFIIFAHVDSAKGLFEELNGSRLEHIFSDESILKRTLGFQKVRSFERQTRVKSLLKDNYPALVEGSDCKSLTDITERADKNVFLKLGDFSFEAVKFALIDWKNRVSSKQNRYQHSYIQSISFEGAGALGGKTVNFSPELNTLIGIRGSGKSSILEGVRYALDIPLSEKTVDVSYKNELVKHLLKSGGKIVVNAVDQHNQHYQISRILNEKADVYIDGILQPGISIRETIIHKPIYFGQKDLSNSGEGFEKELIEKLMGENLVPIRHKITQAQDNVVAIIRQLKQLEKNISNKSELIEKKQDAEYRLKFYKEHGIEEKLDKQIEYAKDERRLTQIKSFIDEYIGELRAFIHRFEDDLKNHIRYKSKYNYEFFDVYFHKYKVIIEDFNQLKIILEKKTEYVDILEKAISEFNTHSLSLKEEFAIAERKLAEELKNSIVSSINTEEFKKLKIILEQAEQQLNILSKAENDNRSLNQELEQALIQLNECYLEEYRLIENILKNINQPDSPLKIKAEFKGNKVLMLKYMQEIFKGSRLQGRTFSRLVEEFSDFSAMWRSKEKVKEIIGESEVFWHYFNDNLSELLKWQVSNQFTIFYHDKPLSQHSLGQRASALMLFVLSQKENNLIIIDQPEDDLDNQTIYDDVIKLIRQLKPITQFIFATHNANIPVLGDAEQVIACEYLKDRIDFVANSIDSDEIQNRIVNIMEGGIEAFERRKQVYELWKP